jgi:uncharacterized protein involved in exopolysaccharide biosynthesis
LDFVATAVRQQRLVLTCALGLGLLSAVAVYFFMSVKYESEALILPPNHPSEPLTGGTLMQLELQLAASQGVPKRDAQSFWGKVLTSRTVADYMIDRFDLKKEYKTNRRSSAERKLTRRSTFDQQLSGMISIRVQDPNPVRAAAMANGYVAALQETADTLAISDAAQRQAFFEAQVDREKQQLAQAEKALGVMQHKTGIVSLKGQTGTAIGQIAAVKGQIQALTVEMEAQGSSETAQDPDMARMQAEMDGLKAQLAKLEQQNADVETMGDVGASALPAGAVDYMRAVRDLRYHESLYQALAKHVASAEMDQERKAPTIQVVDAAVPSEKPAGLPRPLYVMVGVMVGAILGWIAALIRESYRKMKQSPSGRYRLQLIHRELHPGELPSAKQGSSSRPTAIAS